MVKLDLYGGLLGNGKTTLIKRMLETAYTGYRVAVIENEIGEINLDAEEFAENSVCVREMTAGCLCCTVKGSFQEAVRRIAEQEKPDYIVVEPTGTADIRGVLEACEKIAGVNVNRCILVVNAGKIQLLLKVVGEFFYDQLRTVRTVYLNFSERLDRQQAEIVKRKLWEINPCLKIVDTPMDRITGEIFGEGESWEKQKTAGTKNPIAVYRAGEPVKMFSGTKDVKKLLTWTLRFPNAFSKKSFDRLLVLLQDKNHCELWRVKGYLRMQDGSTRKLDMVYGEVFWEEKEPISEEKTGALILIGRKLDQHWLQKEWNQS